MIQRYLPLLPIEAVLLAGTRWSWMMHEKSWRNWAEWYVQQPSVTMTQWVGVSALREPIAPDPNQLSKSLPRKRPT